MATLSIVGILTFLLLIALIGFIVWLITEKIPMSDTFKTVLNVVVVVLIILFLIGLLTGKTSLPHF